MPTRKPITMLVAFGVLLLLFVAASEAQAPLDTTLALETFDEAWRIVRDTHFDPEMNGVDWEAVREELRPQAEDAESREALRGVIAEMLGRLGQSHFAVFPSETVDQLESFGSAETEENTAHARDDDDAKAAKTKAKDDADPEAEGDGVVGLDARLLGERLVVTRIEPGYPASESGVRVGWVVTRVGEREISELVEFVRQNMADGLYREDAIINEVFIDALTGPPGSKVGIRFLNHKDKKVKRKLVRRAAKGKLVRFGNLPPMLTRVEERKIATEEGGEVGMVSLSTWMVPAMADLDRALFGFRDLDGVVIDLRGNPGGVGAMVMGTAGHFIDDKVDLGTMRMRTNSLKFAVNPRLVDADGNRVGVFGGPLAILVDGLSASTSEVFAGGMQEVGRARVFGDTTMGAVLPAQMERLPSGDVLYHAFAEYVTPSGIALEGRGVVPDESVALERSELLDGRDAQLEAALRWIAAETAKPTAPAGGRSNQEGTP